MMKHNNIGWCLMYWHMLHRALLCFFNLTCKPLCNLTQLLSCSSWITVRSVMVLCSGSRRGSPHLSMFKGIMHRAATRKTNDFQSLFQWLNCHFCTSTLANVFTCGGYHMHLPYCSSQSLNDHFNRVIDSRKCTELASMWHTAYLNMCLKRLSVLWLPVLKNEPQWAVIKGCKNRLNISCGWHQKRTDLIMHYSLFDTSHVNFSLWSNKSSSTFSIGRWLWSKLYFLSISAKSLHQPAVVTVT